MLVLPLHRVLDLRAHHFQRTPLALLPDVVLLFVVSVPNPLGHIGKPALPAFRLDLSDQILVAERIQPAENFPDHADEGAFGIVVRGDGAEGVPRPGQRMAHVR